MRSFCFIHDCFAYAWSLLSGPSYDMYTTQERVLAGEGYQSAGGYDRLSDGVTHSVPAGACTIFLRAQCTDLFTAFLVRDHTFKANRS